MGIEKPQFRRYGQIDYDSMRPFDSNPTDPPIQANDIIPIRRAAGGGNLTAQVSDLSSAIIPDPLLIGDGSEAAPSLGFLSNPDTGLFLQGGNRAAWTVDGDETMRWDDEGFEGKVATKSWLLNIEDEATDTDPVFAFSNDGNTGIGSAGADLLSGIAGGVEIWRAKMQPGDSQLLVIQGDNNTPGIGFLNDEDTGLANLFGNQITSINGGTRTWNWSAAQFNSQFSNGPALLNAAAGPTAINILVDRSDSGTGFSTDSQILGIHANNAIVATARDSQFGVIDGTEALPGLAFNDDLNNGLFRAGVDDWSCVAGGAEYLQFQRDAGDKHVFLHANELQASNPNGPFMNNTSVTAGTTAGFQPNKTDLATGIGWLSAGNLTIVAGNAIAVRFENPADLVAGETSLHVFDDDNNTVEQVTVGAADSGGAGFKLLRIPN